MFINLNLFIMSGINFLVVTAIRTAKQTKLLLFLIPSPLFLWKYFGRVQKVNPKVDNEV